MEKRFKIGYIDDDNGMIYGFGVELTDAALKFSKTVSNDITLELEVIELHTFGDKEEFLKYINTLNLHGLILDYNLTHSEIYKNALQIWTKIKQENPLFPIALLTSEEAENVEPVPGIIEIFYKDAEGKKEYFDVFKYITDQFKISENDLDNRREIVNYIKNTGTVSYDVLKLEKSIDEHYQIYNPKDAEVGEQFENIIERAYTIINKYKDIYDEK